MPVTRGKITKDSDKIPSLGEKQSFYDYMESLPVRNYKDQMAVDIATRAFKRPAYYGTIAQPRGEACGNSTDC